MPTKSKLVYLPSAQHDFEEIVKYHITEAGTPYARKIYGTINTEEAGTLVFSGVPAFFVTIVLLVQCSVKQKFIVVQPMKTSL